MAVCVCVCVLGIPKKLNDAVSLKIRRNCYSAELGNLDPHSCLVEAVLIFSLEFVSFCQVWQWTPRCIGANLDAKVGYAPNSYALPFPVYPFKKIGGGLEFSSVIEFYSCAKTCYTELNRTVVILAAAYQTL